MKNVKIEYTDIDAEGQKMTITYSLDGELKVITKYDLQNNTVSEEGNLSALLGFDSKENKEKFIQGLRPTIRMIMESCRGIK